MTNPKASLVVPSRGGASRLPHLFEALRKQTESSWEAIVVLDGDIDDSASIVDAAAAQGLPVRSIVFPENRGRSAALNAGFADARGDVFIRCDDDLRPASNYVADQFQRHADEPVGVVGLVRNLYPETAYARAYGYARDMKFREDAYGVPAERRWRYWCGNVSTTRDTYQLVGEYDTDFRSYGWEDVEWGFRLAKAGIPVEFAPELETDHYIAATTTEIRVRRAFYSGAARLTFDSKHGHGASGSYDRGTGIWGHLVARTARNGLPSLLASARKLDATLDTMPRWLAEKRVSLLVEAAATSGLERPEQVGVDV